MEQTFIQTVTGGCQHEKLPLKKVRYFYRIHSFVLQFLLNKKIVCLFQEHWDMVKLMDAYDIVKNSSKD